jgi:transcriptional regulator with XRE-family HTH domain
MARTGREQLAARRRALGLSQEQLAQELHVATGTYARWERGEASPLVGFRPRLASRLGISLTELDQWLNDGDGDSANGRRLDPEWSSVYVSMEQSAARIDAYEPHYFHGLLQTSDYAHALAQESRFAEEGGAFADRYVEMRLNRQAALTRDRQPLELHVVVAETALRVQVGGAETMRSQLDHVARMNERPNVTVQVLPFSSGPHAASRGAFAFMSFPWDSGPSVVYLESYIGGASYIESSEEIAGFTYLFERLRRRVLSPDASADLMRRLAKEQAS